MLAIATILWQQNLIHIESESLNQIFQIYGHDAEKPHPSLSQSTQVNEKSCRLKMGAYRDGVKRKGDKIGMGL